MTRNSSKFRLIHVALLSALILICGYGLLWIVHTYLPQPFQHTEIFLLALIYLILIGITAYLYSTGSIRAIHQHIGLRSVKIKHLSFAIIAALFIWLFDYVFQTTILQISLQQVAEQWYLKNTGKAMILVFISSVMIAPLIEEMLFRGVFQQTINHYVNVFWSALILSILFALIHFDLSQSLSLFVAAMTYSWITFKSKSIIPAIVAHIINNFITFVYYLSIAR